MILIIGQMKLRLEINRWVYNIYTLHPVDIIEGNFVYLISIV